MLRRPIFEAENMAIEQSFQEMASEFKSDGDLSLKQKRESSSTPTAASENSNGCFDCNICLDSAHDPVVTLCGHLYCWPCIYKWLHVQSSSLELDQQQQQKCPVCKANISDTSLVPLYGRSTSPTESEAKKPHRGLVVPRRPSCGLHTLITTTTSTSHPSEHFHSNPFQSQSVSFPDPRGSFATIPSSALGVTAMASIFNPMIGMIGETALARMFGIPDTTLFAYPYPNSYPLMGSGSPRMRRQEMQLDKSLNRVSIFLFCCFILCLLLF